MGTFVARQLLWQAMCASQVILPAFQKPVDAFCTQLFGAILVQLNFEITSSAAYSSWVATFSSACHELGGMRQVLSCGRWVLDACNCQNVVRIGSHMVDEALTGMYWH